MRQKARSKRGSVLLAVIVVSMMMMVIISAAISLVGHTTKRTNREYRQKQAYFMASSCLEGFITYLNQMEDTATDDESRNALAAQNIAMLDDIVNHGGVMTIEITNDDGTPLYDVLDDYGNVVKQGVTGRSLGYCYITLTGEGSGRMKAVATGEYLGESKVVVANLMYNPARAKSTLKNALEFANGGSNGSSTYDNIRVIGSTESTSSLSHTNNDIYQIGYQNHTVFAGPMKFLGSAILQNACELFPNAYYSATGAAKAANEGVDFDQQYGTSLTVTRSLLLGSNNSKITPSVVKTASDDTNTYNYVRVGDFFGLMGVSGTQIGQPGADPTKDMLVDIYASVLSFGNPNNLKYSSLGFDQTAMDNLANAIASGAPATYTTNFLGKSGNDYYWKNVASGDEQRIYGNIYTIRKNSVLNGDIYITGINNKVYGDIYLSGNLYSTCANGQFTLEGKLYCEDKSQIKCSDSNLQAYLESKWVYKSNDDWGKTGSTRNCVPELGDDTATIKPYIYYPEDLMQRTGVSEINDIYKSFYKMSGSSYTNELNVKPYVGRDKNLATDSEGNLIDPTAVVTEKYRYFDDYKYIKAAEDVRNAGGITDPETGITIYPDYYITESCVLSSPNYTVTDGTWTDEGDPYRWYDHSLSGTHKTILIDLDVNKKNIVVLMKNGGMLNEKYTLLVKNSTNDTTTDHYHCYFCSDSGVCTLNESYDADATEPSPYSTESYTPTNKEANFYIDCNSSGNGGILDFDFYCAVLADKKIDVGYDDLESNIYTPAELQDVYRVDKSKIIVLLAEGAEFGNKYNSGGTLIMASIFGPRAKVYLNHGRTSLFYVDASHNQGASHNIYIQTSVGGGNVIESIGTNNSGVGCLGSVICKEYEPSGNGSTIIYHEVDDNSMLSKVKGGRSLLDGSYRVLNYSNY